VSRPTGEIEQTFGGIDVPEIFPVAGERAVAAYREFLNNPKWSPNTLKIYGTHVRRFFRWAEGRGLTLESIAKADIIAYGTEVANAKSPQESCVYLTPVRGLFSQLVSSGVLSENPCGTSRPSPDSRN
jgi:site-specific recombinase XerD